MNGLGRDIRDAWRGLLRQPGFSATALLMLSLGIGAACAIFAAVQAVAFELPFADPERVVAIRARTAQRPSVPISIEQFESWQTATDVFEAVAAYTLVSPVLTGRDAAFRLQAEALTPGMFAVLGVQPALGRTFREDDRAVVVLSDEFWRSRFNGDPGVLGRTIPLDSVPTTIVGVMPAGFDGPRSRPGDAWVPLSPATLAGVERPRSISVVARLARGVTPAVASARLQGISPLAPDASSWTIVLEPHARIFCTRKR